MQYVAVESIASFDWLSDISLQNNNALSDLKDDTEPGSMPVKAFSSLFYCTMYRALDHDEQSSHLRLVFPFCMPPDCKIL